MAQPALVPVVSAASANSSLPTHTIKKAGSSGLFAVYNSLKVFSMLIKQTDYHRIYSVINSLLLSENANPATASMYFSVFGAYLLKQHFKINATPKSGLAAYRFGNDIMLFADQKEDGFITGDGENFHCWIEADGWAIDFMAPAFTLNGMPLPAKMLQKTLTTMAADINSLNTSGDFFYVSAPLPAALQAGKTPAPSVIWPASPKSGFANRRKR
jgi:Protein of unknown function (DUF2026)